MSEGAIAVMTMQWMFWSCAEKSSSQRRWIDWKRKESPFVISPDIFTFLIVIHGIHHPEMLFQETITDNDIFQARNETYILSSSCKSWARGAHAYSIFKFSTSVLVPQTHYSFLQLKRVKCKIKKLKQTHNIPVASLKFQIFSTTRAQSSKKWSIIFLRVKWNISERASTVEIIENHSKLLILGRATVWPLLKLFFSDYCSSAQLYTLHREFIALRGAAMTNKSTM